MTKWYEISQDRMCSEHNKGFKVIKPKDSFIVPILCPVCNMSMFSHSDIQIYKEYECCESCRIRWVDLNKEKWLTGWRPSKKQIKKEKTKRLARPRLINL